MLEKFSNLSSIFYTCLEHGQVESYCMLNKVKKKSDDKSFGFFREKKKRDKYCSPIKKRSLNEQRIKDLLAVILPPELTHFLTVRIS